MARTKTVTVGDLEVVEGVERPKREGGPGRTRIPTVFDDRISGWYELGQDEENGWVTVRVRDSEHMKQTMNDLRKAAQYHGNGITRHPNEEDMTITFRVHDVLDRGPKGPRNTEGNGEVEETE